MSTKFYSFCVWFQSTFVVLYSNLNYINNYYICNQAYCIVNENIKEFQSLHKLLEGIFLSIEY